MRREILPFSMFRGRNCAVHLRTIIGLIIVMATVSVANAQILVKGTVNEESGGTGLPGVNVLLKGTTRGTSSDANGNYSLEVQDGNAVLVFSFIGYETKEVVVGQQSTINVTLQSSVESLAEVVVVGYGTQNKRDITGAIVSVKGETLQEVAAPNMLSQLKGRAAGVSIVSNGATPGSQGQIRIRGNRSLSTSSDGSNNLDGPLVVVDGVPYGGLNDINPNDIVNMEILKDASATAIYGSRGSGGVILITTKRGKGGKPVLTYDGYHGVSTAMGKYNVMNGQEYAQFKLDAAKYNATSPGTTGYALTPKETEALAAGVSTDWQDLIYKSGYLTNHQLGLQGGTETTQYAVGAGYLNETGIIPNQNFQRYTLRLSVDQKLGNHFKLGLSTNNSLTYQNNAGGDGVANGLVRLTPLANAYNADGTVNLNPAEGSIDAAGVSPLTMITKKGSVLSQNRSIRTFNTGYLEVNILPSLRYRFNAGLNFSQSAFNGYSGPNTYYNTATVQTSSDATTSNTEYWDLNFQHLLYYDKIFAEKHKFGFTGLFETTQNHSKGSSFNVKGVPADYVQNSNFALASGQPTGSGSFTEQGLISYMGRINYTFNNRYNATFTIRRDGFSALAPGHQYFNYPAVGLSWNVIDESFMESIPVVSNLKLRGSYGLSGNKNVSPYATLGALSSGYYNFGTTTAGQVLAYTVTTLPAPDLGWQSTKQLDIGLDVGVFDERITVAVDWYQQKTSNLLLDVSLPATNGAGTTKKNLGKTSGRGLEVSLSAAIVKSQSGFNWSADVNYFFNREKIEYLTSDTEKNNVANGWFVGQPMSVIYDYKKIGIWQTGDAGLSTQTSPVQKAGQIRVEDWNSSNAKPGDANYGIPDGKIDGADRQILGNFQPKFEAGITNRFTFKNFDLSIVTYARMGMKVVVPYLTGNSTGSGGFAFFNQSRVNQVKVDYWTDTNPTNAFPAPDAGNAVQYFGSTLGYYDGSFIKVRSINFGYTFSNELIRKIGMSSARVYFNATNPFILYSPLVHDKLAIDPEGNGYAGNTNSSTSNTLGPQGSTGGTSARQIAVNLNNPPTRQFILGVNLKF